ncbi:MAG: beta-N-acetylhexosaminidase [Proteobacteria bacterium]|nr:beta-N-acetylhexosaminidase [Pseudomonadota bacterium]
MNRLRPALAALALACSLPATARANPADDPHLIPKPRVIDAAAGTADLPRTITIAGASNDDDKFAARDLADALKERGLKAAIGTADGAYRVTFARLGSATANKILADHHLAFTDEMKGEGYVLVTTAHDAHVVAATAAGIFYGAQTLKQLVRTDAPKPRILLVTIRDWPAMKYRGWQDDLSRGRVPTLDFQKKQIRTLAAYKLNVFSPYYEHTLAYANNPLIAPPGGSTSKEDVKALVAYAAKYHVDVIPEQEAFGHLHHLLKYDIYAGMGETPHGHVLAPGDPNSLPLIKSMFAEIDSLFPSKFVHIGADETFELGLGRTKERVQKEGIGTVYLSFLKDIETTLKPSGKRLLFWGDVAQNHGDLVKMLPKDMIAVGWDYWSTKNFERYVKPFTDAGIETWVAPGVNNWNRVFPNNDIGLRNIQGFIRDGQKMGSTGVINTTWGDDGEAIFNETWYGFIFGAAASWQPGESSIPDFQHSYGLQFHGDASGKIDDAMLKLAAAHVLLQKSGVGEATNELYWLDPYSVDGQIAAQKIRVVSRDYRILAESALVLIAQARQQPRIRETAALDAIEMGARRMDFIGMKFELADEIVQYYARAGNPVNGSSPAHDLDQITSRINARTQDLRDGYVLGGELYEKAWLAENRPYFLRNVLNRYDQSAQLWITRGDKVAAARSEMNRTKKLPPAESIGIPSSMPGIVVP